jgi:tetratricopeptide (TPR) repeat protein
MVALLGPSLASLGETASPLALKTAIALADSSRASDRREELQQEICFELIRRGDFAAAKARATPLPAFRHAAVVLELAGRLPTARRAEAEQLVVAAHTDQELTLDWHKSRVSRLLAVTQARLGLLESAAKTAREVPDTEDRAFALMDVVRELSRRDEVALAQGLADAIEENRRYGTYRQKAGALSAIALALYQRGDRAEAGALLSQAAALLPKKPGWSDGEALRDVAAAQLGCGQTDAGRELLARAETLARGIAGAWRVTEMSAVAKVWLAAGEPARARSLIQDAEKALSSIPSTERAPESLTLARVQHTSGNFNAARALIRAVLNDDAGESDAEAKRARQVRALLVWAELFGDEAVAELKL